MRFFLPVLLTVLLLAGCTTPLVTPGSSPNAAINNAGSTPAQPAATTTGQPVTVPSPTSTSVPPMPAPTATSAPPVPTGTPVKTGLSGKVLDASTGNPISGATIRLGEQQTSSDTSGSYKLDQPGSANGNLNISAHDYASATLPYTGQTSLDVKLQPTFLSGTVTDKLTGKPVMSATIYAYAFGPQVSASTMLTAPMQVVSATTSSTGAYTLHNIPANATLTLAWPGYLGFKQKIEQQARLDIALERHVVKGIYMTYYVAGNKKMSEDLIALTERTEVNTIVVDLKGDRGYTLFKSNVPLAGQIGSNQEPMVDDIDAFIKTLKQKNIYLIARIVTFKDNMLATGRPDLAIKNTKTGQPWIDNEKLGWADPYQKEVWDYDAGLAREAILHGFDEVQFDYIRFPTDGNLNVLGFSQENTAANRVAALTGFLEKVKREVKPLGGFMSADVFGYTVFNTGELEIGQNFEEIGKRLDYISPMIYPSTYSSGLPGSDYLDIAGTVSHPYDVVYISSKHAAERLAGYPVIVRPWIQDFDDYAYDERKYGVAEVSTQLKAVYDAGLTGWLLWSPSNEYTEGALQKK